LNSVDSTAGVLVDTAAPTVSSVNVPANGTYIEGQNLDFTVSFSEAVTVTTTGGTPYVPVTLDTGGTVNASYVSGTGTSSLLFHYTIIAGNRDADGIAVGTDINANGGTIKDTAGNDTVLTLNSVGSTSGVLVDAVVPTVTSVNVPANGTYIAGQNLDFTVNFSEAVNVTGAPYIPVTLDTGGTVHASYVSGTGTSSLLFRYAIAEGNLDPNGIAVGAVIEANGGTLKDAANNNADLTLNNVGDTSNIIISKGIAVTVPNGGEAWEAGSTQTIKWRYTGNTGSIVKIELLKSNIVNQVISYGTSIGINGSGIFRWTISSKQAVGSDYKVRITSMTNKDYTDTSDNVFDVISPPQPSIVVIAPDGGEAWKAGSTQSIKWRYTGKPGSLVKIELLKNNVVNRVITYATSIGSNGSGTYKWTIPSRQAVSDYKIRITSITNKAYTDTSNGVFGIK